MAAPGASNSSSSNMSNNEENKNDQLLLTAQERYGSTIVIEQFLKFNPSSFDGTAAPLATEKWLEDMERIYRVMECIDVEKVSCASFMLKNRACHWWESSRRTKTAAERNMTWARFRQLVLEKYFPEALRDQKEAKLPMSQSEYEHKFDELSHLAPQLVKVESIECGLNPTNEGEKQERLEKRHLDALEPKGNNNESPNKKKRSNQKHCTKCNRHHRGECLFGKNVCFKCHQPGHMSRSCTQNQGNKENNDKKAKAKRSFKLK